MIVASVANSESGPIPSRSIIVVGAGIAGLAAARVLHDRGLAVVVLEARDRLGGRIYTDRSWDDVCLDLGASWIHGTSANPVYTLVRRNRIVTQRTNYDSAGVAYRLGGLLFRSIERSTAEKNLRRILGKIGRARSTFGAEDSLGGALKRVIAAENLSLAQ
ncbi:MAG: FAD-dependent oxidoreductase, partial [Terriglobia bacterium]